MKILAVDTATNGCSVALTDGEHLLSEINLVSTQTHSRHLTGMIRDACRLAGLAVGEMDAYAVVKGPGSFTGLRIGASAVQGLAYTSGLPVVPVSTLALQAQTALRLGVVDSDSAVLSMLDARINEVYYALCGFAQGIAVVREGPVACAAGSVVVDSSITELAGVGSGCRFREELAGELRSRLLVSAPDLLPAARDLVPIALAAIARGEVQQAQDVQPVYVRDEINWKKLAEQGKRQ